MRVISNSPEQTREMGELLGRLLDKGAVVALIGELGSGKTVFAQGLARGLGVASDEYVSSPSFTIVNQYRGRVPIFHVDTYRLRSEPEMVALGYEEYFESNGATVIEWADKVQGLLPDRYISVHFAITGPESRELEIELVGPWPAEEETEIAQTLGRAAI